MRCTAAVAAREHVESRAVLLHHRCVPQYARPDGRGREAVRHPAHKCVLTRVLLGTLSRLRTSIARSAAACSVSSSSSYVVARRARRRAQSQPVCGMPSSCVTCGACVCRARCACAVTLCAQEWNAADTVPSVAVTAGTAGAR
jgi:hypothetical protein